jgi:hypothetical protein
MWLYSKKNSPRENYAPDDPRVIKAQELRRAGMSYEQIAVQIGLYPVAVQRFCNCPKYTQPKKRDRPPSAPKMTVTRHNVVSVGRLAFWSQDDVPLHLTSSTSQEHDDGSVEYTITVRAPKLKPQG